MRLIAGVDGAAPNLVRLGRTMQNLIPHYVAAVESDNRGIKEGWYAVSRNGSLRFGPFFSREICVDKIAARDEPVRI